MKILYVVTAAGFGGAPQHVLYLMEHMVRERHIVALACAPEPRLIQEAQRLGATVYPNLLFVREPSPVKDFLALKPMLRAIRAFGPDLIHAHSTKAGFAARLCAALLGIKQVVFTSHGWAFHESEGRWKRLIYTFAERYAACVTKKIICVSDYNRNLALRHRVGRPDQLVVIHNGVNSALFTRKDGVHIRTEFNLRQSFVITMVSRLAPPKDLQTLLKAVAQLPDDCKLLLVGDGELRQEVQSSIHAMGLTHRVILAGNRSDVADILAGSDVFALASRAEGFGLTIVEAMMSGLPVVASSVGAVPELIDNGETGFLVPQGDWKKFAEALTRLRNDEKLRARMGLEGRRRAVERFGLDTMLEATTALYDEVLHGSRPA